MSGHNGFKHNTMALVRLDAGRVELLPWPEELGLASERALVGGVAAGERLLALYPDALILASGPLSGAMTPGSGLLTASCAGPEGTVVHTPFLLRHGPALKTAGVDFLVIQGQSASPVALTVERQAFRLNPATELLGQDVYGMRKRLRAKRPDGRPSLILCGPAGQRGLECASVGLEHGQSLDRGAVACWMGGHKLLAVILAGGGALPGASAIRSPLFERLSPQQGTEGFFEVFGWTGGRTAGGVEGVSQVKSRLGRAAACWLCPRPCLAYLKPDLRSREGALCADHVGLAALYDALGQAAPAALLACARHGFDARAASTLLKNAGAAPDPDAAETLLAEWASGKSSPPAPLAQPTGSPIPRAPQVEAEQREAAGLILGICPILLQRCPDLSLDLWLAPLGEAARRKLDAAIAGLDA